MRRARFCQPFSASTTVFDGSPAVTAGRVDMIVSSGQLSVSSRIAQVRTYSFSEES